MNYVELMVTNVFANLAACKIDGVYRSEDNKYYVVEYKTTSTKYTVPPLNSYLPHKENVAQVEAYCALVEQKYNIEVDGWILHYAARDNPFNSLATYSEEVSTKKKKQILKKIEEYSNQFHIVMNATSFKHVRILLEQKPCSSYEEYQKTYSSYEGCPLASVCFESKKLKEELKRAWEIREDEFLTYRRDKRLKIVKL